MRFVQAWGPSTGPTACASAGQRCALWGWREGVPWGSAFRRSEGSLRSGAPPYPAARPLGGLSGSTTHVLWARVCGCGRPALSPWIACPVGAACRGGGGGPSSGGVACTKLREELHAYIGECRNDLFNRQDGRETRGCYNCGEQGHLARDRSKN